MGSCVARFFCSCCDCVVVKNTTRLRKSANTKRSPAFILRRHSSSATIEFENLIFDFDIPESSNSILQLQPTSAEWFPQKGPNIIKPQNVESFSNVNYELPIIDPLMSRIIKPLRESPTERDKVSLGGSSSATELHWENEIIIDEVPQDANDLEWDNYEEESIVFHNETEQLITEIESMTKKILH